jgi:FixJ family two-component response regulator
MTDGLVCVIDDDLSVCRSVGRLLRSHNKQVETYQSAGDFLERRLPSLPACLILDLEMPGVSGLELQQTLVANRDMLPIVFLSGHGSISASVDAMKKGAVDFLSKPVDDNRLMRAVDSALDQAQQAHRRRQALDHDRAAFNTLTERERQVCIRVARGMLNKQIGYEFGTTEKTIKVQRGRVMQKLGAHSVADLVRLVDRLISAGDKLPDLNLQN